MGAAAEFGFALDVDDTLFAHERFGRDAHGASEREVTDLIDRQGIDLSDNRAAHVDHDRIVVVGVVNFLFVEVVAKAVFIESLDHIFVGNVSGVVAAGPVIGFLQYPQQRTEAN